MFMFSNVQLEETRKNEESFIESASGKDDC